MRLISLTANKDSFHPVHFNKAGLNLILASQKESAEVDIRRTYNGVGKSLMVAIIHYCLGSNNVKAFQEKLPTWEFQLCLEHAGTQYRVSRATEVPNKVTVDGEEMSLSSLRVRLGNMAFPAMGDRQFLTFRNLIPSFIRRNRDAYAAFDSAGLEKQDFQKLLRLAYLLGLDVDIVAEKQQLRQHIVELDNRIKQFEKDKLFRAFLGGESDALIQLQELAAKINKCETRLRAFQIAEDYYAKQHEANLVTTDLQSVRNKRETLTRAIDQIEKSIKIQPDLDPSRVIAVYEEAIRDFPGTVKHRIEEVLKFRSELIERRNTKLAKDKRRLLKERDALTDELKQLDTKRDALLRYLGEHKALDEYLAMSDELSKLRAEQKKIQDYQQLLGKYTKERAKYVAELKQENVRTNEYLEEIGATLQSNMETFVRLSSRFYEEKPGGITVKNNEGDNQLRFDIVAKIEDDASDGINEVKIFCFDMMVLEQKHNHAVDFLFHDSRLFSDMDHRQRATALRVALEESENTSFQYIATLNQDQLEACHDCLTPTEWEEIQKRVVLTLTDDSPSSKLLGIQVDMNYEE